MELFRLLGTIAIDNQAANQELDETTEKAEKSQSKMVTAFKKIGTAVAAGFAVTTIVNFGKQLVSLAEDTREYRNEMGKLETAFTSAGHSTEDATDTYRALQQVLGETDQAVEAANHLAKLTTNEKDLQKWTDICTGVYATFGASLPIEGLTEAANETSRTGQLTGVLADALNWAGVNEDEFQASLDKCNSQQERQALITETLNGLYKDTAANYKEINKDVLAANAAQERITSAMARFGAILEPVVTAGKAGFASLLEACLPFAEALAEKIPVAMQTLQGVWDSVLKPVLQLLGDIVTKIAIPAIQLLITRFKEMATAAQEHFGFLLEVVQSAIDIISEIIAAFTAATEGDWKAFWNSIVKIIKSFGSAIKAAGEGIFQMLWDGMKSVWTSVESWVSEKVSWITDKLKAVKSALASIKAAVAEAASAAVELVSNAVSSSASKSTKSTTTTSTKTTVKKNAAGGILTKPTIFGFTPSTGQWQLGGEAGDEAIAPIDTLQQYVRAAVADEMKNDDSEKVASRLEQMIELLQTLINVTGNTKIELNGREFGRAVKEYA